MWPFHSSAENKPSWEQTDCTRARLFFLLVGVAPVQFSSHSPLQNSSLLSRWAMCALVWPDTIGPASAVAMTPFVLNVSYFTLWFGTDLPPTLWGFVSLLGPVSLGTIPHLGPFHLYGSILAKVNWPNDLWCLPGLYMPWPWRPS